jgi:hypothetical protein
VADPYEFEGIEWDGNGYFGVPRISPKDRGPETQSDEPWYHWVVAFSRATRGDFAAVAPLLNLRANVFDPVLRQLFYFLFGDACPASAITELRSDLEDEDDTETVLLAANALATVGRLADVPAILEAYKRCADEEDAQVLPLFIRDVLGTGCPRPEGLPMDKFEKEVLAKCEELTQSFGTNSVFLFQGERLNVVRVAQHVLAATGQPAFRSLYRRKFEAMTGIDCSQFYKSKVFQPMTAAMIVESFLEGPEVAQYQDGVRYFFGHRIPD